MDTARSRPDLVQLLRDDFRHHLETFYARLKLAPPYHSVEKAITHLTALLKAMPPEERARVAADPGQQWALFRRAFVESGLHRETPGHHRWARSLQADRGPAA